MQIPPLTKSRFTTGWQCTKLLWWTVREPGAPELEPSIVEEDRLAQGRAVGVLARDTFPGGVLIDRTLGTALAAEATRNALDAGVPALFEATFVADEVAIACDVLLRDGDGWVLIEVKSSSSQKDEHVPDAAVQVHVLRRAGLAVRRAEIMHLDRTYRHPDGASLFARTDVTDAVEMFLPQVPGLIAGMREALAGRRPPAVPVGLQCWTPRDCPFFDRCWPAERDHVRRLYYAYKRDTVARMAAGIHTIHDIPAGDINPRSERGRIQQRQLEATRTNTVVVGDGLGSALADLSAPVVGYLDFETIQRAIPVFDGLGPWAQMAAQFSYHERQADGAFTHQEFLAEGPADPRRAIAEALLAATAGADKIQMYTNFEQQRIRELADQLPDHAEALRALAAKLVDLRPAVWQVYHPDFRGSFSMKDILTPLVPDLTYEDLVIVDGLTASVQIARLMFFEHLVRDRDQLKADLLAYCKQDTWAMVEVERALRDLATAGDA